MIIICYVPQDNILSKSNVTSSTFWNKNSIWKWQRQQRDQGSIWLTFAAPAYEDFSVSLSNSFSFSSCKRWERMQLLINIVMKVWKKPRPIVVSHVLENMREKNYPFQLLLIKFSHKALNKKSWMKCVSRSQIVYENCNLLVSKLQKTNSPNTCKPRWE